MLMAVSGSSASYPTNFDGPVGGEAPYPAAAMGAGSREILSGEAVMTDIVTSYNGYHSDNARDFFTGPEPPRELLDAHEFCTDIISEIESAARPGRICSDVFKEIDALAKKRGEPQGFMGFGKNRVKFFGHGVGLELDELPVIADRVDIEIVPGMIIAVEPKAFLPHIGPAGIENTYVVEENGLSSLCGHPRRLIDV